MATLRNFATKLGLVEKPVETQPFFDSNIGLCQTCGALKFNPECPECTQARWQSLLMGVNAEEQAEP